MLCREKGPFQRVDILHDVDHISQNRELRSTADECDAPVRIDHGQIHENSRVSVEAGTTTGWWKFVGTDGRTVGIDHFGASADGALLMEKFGITSAAVVTAAKESIASANAS